MLVQSQKVCRQLRLMRAVRLTPNSKVGQKNKTIS